MPLLPIDTWRAIMQYHPWFFWGMADGQRLRVTSACNGLVTEYGWQSTDAASRNDIRTAIENAEALIRDQLGYSVAPRYTTAEVPWPRYLDASLTRVAPIGADGRWLSVQLPEGYVQAAGVEQLTAISLAAAVTYSDQDGDGYKETFTVGPVATTITDPAQIAAYVPAAARFNGPDFSSDVGARWRIEPVNISISGGFVTITGARWLLIPPLTYQGLIGIGTGLDPDPSNAATALQTLDIYQRTTNQAGILTTDSQATIVWDTHPAWGGGWWCCCSNCTGVSPYSGSPFDPAAIAQATGRVALLNAQMGIVSAPESVYNASTGIWSSFNWSVCAAPDRVIVRTLSGYPLASDGQMDRKWAVAVARLAAAELARPICACDEANRELYRWQFDLARTGGAADEAYGAISAEDLNNPFGTRRGHVYAWKVVSDLRQMRGMLP